MRVTPLQKLLRDKALPVRAIMDATGRSRHTVWRWKRGFTFPARADAEQLIALFGPDRLDFDGCYKATVDLPDGQD